MQQLSVQFPFEIRFMERFIQNLCSYRNFPWCTGQGLPIRICRIDSGHGLFYEELEKFNRELIRFIG
jgi:hypothetical protein